MHRLTCSLVLIAAMLCWTAAARAEDKQEHSKPKYDGPACTRPVDTFFADEVWGKVGSLSCLTCHKTGGDAEDTKFVLTDPQKSEGAARETAMRQNQDAFARIAQLKEGNDYRVLLKVAGKLDHGGKDVLKPDSTGYRILADFVRRENMPAGSKPVDVADDKNAPPFFDG